MLRDQLQEKIVENKRLSELVSNAEKHITALQDEKSTVEGALKDAMEHIQVCYSSIICCR